jgi:orotidine-5'-phosphate decarboxylase
MSASARTPVADRERLIVALDVPTVEEAEDIVDELGDSVAFYKIGMQLQFAGGLALADRLIHERKKKVFLDSKLLDISNTITSAVRSIAKLGVSFLTVHGNAKVIRAAIEGRGTSDLKILSVTYLTNLDHFDLMDLGVVDATADTVKQYVLRRARSAVAAGADGVIASGLEAADIRAMAGESLKIITPGIRENGAPLDDQRRIMSAYNAIRSGADYLVVGRPITRSPDKKAAADRMVQEISSALADVKLAAE